MGKGPVIVGGLLGLGLLAWRAGAGAQAPRAVVTTSVLVRRGVRPKWRGTGHPAAGLPAPKYAMGQEVVIRNPPEPGVAPDAAVEGKKVKVVERVYYEVVGYTKDGAAVPLPEPGSWGYVTDLKIDGQPVTVAETSLVPAK